MGTKLWSPGDYRMSNKESGGKYAVLQINKLKEDRGNVCEWQQCNTTDNLEWAHKLPTKVHGRGRGSWNRLNDILRYPFSYYLLCSTHHRVFDDNER